MPAMVMLHLVEKSQFWRQESWGLFNGNYTITDTYTDNIFGALNNDGEAKWSKEKLGKVWEIRDVGENEHFLGM